MLSDQLALALLVTAVAVMLAWVTYQIMPEKVSLVDRKIIKKYRGSVKQMPLSRLAEITFSYHAVVGFVGVWEFVDKSGDTLWIDAEANGIKRLIAGLEQVLPGFSRADFEQKFRAGDVEDSIQVWKLLD